MNKKGFFGVIAIVAATLGAMVLSSCSHDDDFYSEEKVEQLVNNKYAIAFENAFGKVGSEVDWGFSSRSANARTMTRAGEVAFTTTITFPEYCNASDFKETYPEGATKLPDDGAYEGTRYIDGTTQKVAMWGNRGSLYVTGNVDLSNSTFEVNAGTKIYLVKGSTLKLSAVSAENLKGDYYIGENATLETSGLLKVNANSKVYTHENGTIKAGDLEVNSTSFLYNKGTVLVTTGTVSAESNSSYIVNGGSIECANVVVNAGAVLNYFDWNVSGTTHINSNNSGWINNGQWVTYDYAYLGGSENVINNCSLTVTHDFDMNISSLAGVVETKIGFKINSEGSVVTENFYGGRNLANNTVEGGPFKIRMAENALFKVNKTATLESGRGSMSEDEEGFGIFGPATGGYAVFQAKDIVRDPELARNNCHGAVTYRGHLYVSAETHFAQGDDGSNPPKPFIYTKGGFDLKTNIFAAGTDFSQGLPNITIEQTECSPGFKGGNPLLRVIAEDLSAAQAGDFDFNDVVFDVVKYEGGYTTLRLQACGGMLPLKIGSHNGIGGVEVHSLYGDNEPDPNTGYYKMWNTSATGNKHDPVDFTIAGEHISPAQLLALPIEVEKDGVWMLLTATKGVAACKILVDDRFPIVPERQSIANKFGNFTTYVQGNWKEDDDFWWIQSK